MTVISVGLSVTSILMVFKFFFSETNRRIMIKNEKYTYIYLGATHELYQILRIQKCKCTRRSPIFIDGSCLNSHVETTLSIRDY